VFSLEESSAQKKVPIAIIIMLEEDEE